MSRKQKSLIVMSVILLTLSITGYFHSILKSSPPGMSYRSEAYQISENDIDFLYDLTYQNATGKIVAEQQIFDTIFAGIDVAQQYILLDMFLFNSFGDMPDKNPRDITGALTTKLLEKKQNVPDIRIDFITDQINNVYGGAVSQELQTLQEAGINVIYTNLEQLRDSNLLYSPIWRVFFQWFGNSRRGGILPHPFSEDEEGVTLRSYLTLLNFKANHRKIFLADDHDTVVTIISSANPHNGSSAHSNVALHIQGDFWQEVYSSESSIAGFSGGKLQEPGFPMVQTESSENPVNVQLLTEDEIEDELLMLLNDVKKGDNISIGTFYLSDQEVIEALVRASQREAYIRLILDPSNDAFGQQKYGIPNQPAAQELIAKSQGNIQVRWYVTHGEQYHAKFTMISKQNGITHLFLGSANLTRRNLDNYNLELNVKVTANSSAPVMQEVQKYYERIWHNERGNQYTMEYAHHKNRSFVKKILYRAAEFAGLSTF